MEESSKQYTAFAVAGSGLFQFTRMPFGLTNAPATFQRLIDNLFPPQCEPHVFGYLDDLIVVTETFESHLHWLELVLTKIAEAELTPNEKKCDLGMEQLTYLGFLLDHEGLRPDPGRVKSVLDFPTPTSVTQQRSFLDMVGWYSRFIPGESAIKLLLLKLLLLYM